MTRGWLLLVILAVILIAGGVWVGQKYWLSQAPPPEAELSEPKIMREVSLYFVSSDGTYLSAESREIEDCLELVDCISNTVQALVDGPASDLISVLPPQTRLLGVVEEGDTVTVDFSRELTASHPGGSLSELMTVYGLVNTIAVNYPHVRQVKVLIEGKSAETLKGHVDLREPVGANYNYIRSEIDGQVIEEPLESSELIDAERAEGIFE